MFGYGKMVRVAQYGKGYRSFGYEVQNGSIFIRTSEGLKVKARIEDNEVVEQKTLRNGKFVYWVKYGEFEKERKDATTYKIMRYRKGTSKGLHGLVIRKDAKLLGYKGTCYSFYSRGKFLWQKFVYENRVRAYYVRWTDTTIKAQHPNKRPLFVINVNSLYAKENKEGYPFLYCRHHSAEKFNYSSDGIYCDYVFYNHRGKIREQGKYERNQKVGEWIEKYIPYFYLSGLPVPKDLYYAEPKDIPSKRVLEIDNAQVRAMFLKKIGYERVVKECKGKVIDTYQDYALIDFPVKYDKEEHQPDKVLRILKVVCPSTKGEYFLKVPTTDDFKTCLKARNGGFTKQEPNAKMVEFAVET